MTPHHVYNADTEYAMIARLAEWLYTGNTIERDIQHVMHFNPDAHAEAVLPDITDLTPPSADRPNPQIRAFCAALDEATHQRRAYPVGKFSRNGIRMLDAHVQQGLKSENPWVKRNATTLYTTLLSDVNDEIYTNKETTAALVAFYRPMP